ncbi:MAG TPA: putative selenate ABC transporter substrate-binding protein [Pseudoneobacillus sp.]|nr:putative selenate ABC transporter substrate-binding protein [Pseudoneobacillus sp.]
MKKWLLSFVSLIFIMSLVACSQGEKISNSSNKEVFNIGMIPDQNVSDINRSMDDFASYLSKKTGLKVKFVPVVDYSALVTGFERGEIQLAWFGGLTGVQARNVVPGSEAIAQRPTDEKFESVFIKQKGLRINSLADLKGYSFTFGSESSTSGHLMPRYFLMEAGINADKDFKGKPNYSGSHDTTYKLVESGAYQTGALNISVWEAAVKEGKVDTNKIEVFYTTPPYYDYNWTINNVDDKYGKGTKDKVQQTILSMTSNDSEMMKLLNTDSFIETNNDNYKDIEKVAKQLGIIK